VNELIHTVFGLSLDVRYVALSFRGAVALRERPDLRGASASESDRYEELLVNPTLLTLLTQRGNIDCGGLRFVIIRYGNFFQIVQPLPEGHLSVAVEPYGDPVAIAHGVEERVRQAFPGSA
jgi:hypothetical protein